MGKTEIRANEMVRAIRDQIYEETKHMSAEEFAAWIRREAALADEEEAAENEKSTRHAA